MSHEQKDGQPGKTGFSVANEQQDEIREPSMYHVILMNDDFTTMEFVLKTVEKVFRKSPEAAAEIMMEVHNKGRGIAGTYIHDIARTKAERVMHLAFKENFPLKCILKEA